MPKTFDAPKALSLVQLWPLIRPERLRGCALRVASAIILLVVESALTVWAPVVLSRIVGVLSVRPEMRAVLWLVAEFAVLRCVIALATPLRNIVFKPVESELQRRLALLGLRHLHGMSVRYHLDRQTGAITRILDRGVSAVESVLNLFLFNVLPNVLELLMTFVVIIRFFHARYLLVLLAAIAVYSSISYAFTRARMAARRRRNVCSGAAQHRLLDSILNFETVRSFGNADYEIQRYDKAQKVFRDADIRLNWLVNLSQATRGLLIALTTAILFVFAAQDVMHHHLGVAQFVLIGAYLRSLYSAVGSLNYVSAGWQNARVDLENYLELLAQRSEIAPPQNPIHIPARLKDGGAASVVFDDVAFGYDTDRQILKGVTLRVPAGSSLAVVGHTGSGKSTLGRLLTRAFDVSSGVVQVDGHDVRAFAEADLQRVIGIVPQDTVLFNAGIGENIAYGFPGAAQSAIEDAARRAQIHDFICTLPQGYETVVGERGLKLSGGEKQRVAIARVLLKDPRILLLDEATSALDTQTEAAIQHELDALSRTRTTVIIAHRLSTVAGVDQIIVMDEGRIIERGTHAELLDLDGQYAKMWRAQGGQFTIRA
ncbi:ABCB family ABC transporter ATP-binding protein/permease [Neokomagataea anthophila]|uniref:ABC transporter ATP-binding protein/permease n=1 Tax=Neokomagataea anthophila TaxID=2826925 RepID=A0ABS5E6C7_9PROT|nr:ATP-binding cassette domain-containing protein [Neokomagataea anthophila]MBR0559455.1 ABC transporter ATP-binding protein/permease [Neokomagataea anthophila]